MVETHLYLTWYLGGRFSLDEDTRLVFTRRLPQLWPPRAVKAQFFTQEVRGELKGPMKPASPVYVKGTVYTLEDVKRCFPEEKIMISNMENNGYPRVYRAPTGEFGVFDDAMVRVGD